MSKKDKNKIGVVFSTNPDFNYEFEKDNQPDTLPPSQQILRVQLDRKQRNGKEVTLVTGFVGQISDCEDLGKSLKQKCGVGGSVKENEIILQGDHRIKVLAFLKEKGFSQSKIAGG